MTHPLPTGTVEACVVVARQAAREAGAELALSVSSPAEVAASINHDRRGEAWEYIVRAVIAEALARVNTKAQTKEPA